MKKVTVSTLEKIARALRREKHLAGGTDFPTTFLFVLPTQQKRTFVELFYCNHTVVMNATARSYATAGSNTFIDPRRGR